MKPLLTICTPSIWSRQDKAASLAAEIQKQTEGCGLRTDHVEHIVLTDNKCMTIGEKRQRLFDSARGEYVAFVDDDDLIMDGYIPSIANACARSGADVITFKQRVLVDGAEGTCVFRLGQQDEPFVAGGTFKRGPWHVCAWRKAPVASCRYLSCNYGEDIAWALQARQLVTHGAFIDAVLHQYTFDSAVSEAPPP